MRDTTRALVYLHTPSANKGSLLHRDVKPANILLDANLNAKLADFGLLRVSVNASYECEHILRECEPGRCHL